MEPFNLSLSQVNFEEKDLTSLDDLHSFSNLVSYDSDFKDDVSEGVPVSSKTVGSFGVPLHKNQQPSGLVQLIALKNKPRFESDRQGHAINHDYGGGTEVVSDRKREKSEMEGSDADGTPDRMHQVTSTPSEQQSLSQSVVSTAELAQPNKPSTSTHSSPSAKDNSRNSMTLDPTEDTFEAFTKTVEALALQKSVIGNKDVTPASADEIAKVIAETQAKLLQTSRASSQQEGCDERDNMVYSTDEGLSRGIPPATDSVHSLPSTVDSETEQALHKTRKSLTHSQNATPTSPQEKLLHTSSSNKSLTNANGDIYTAGSDETENVIANPSGLSSSTGVQSDRTSLTSATSSRSNSTSDITSGMTRFPSDGLIQITADEISVTMEKSSWFGGKKIRKDNSKNNPGRSPDLRSNLQKRSTENGTDSSVGNTTYSHSSENDENQNITSNNLTVQLNQNSNDFSQEHEKSEANIANAAIDVANMEYATVSENQGNLTDDSRAESNQSATTDIANKSGLIPVDTSTPRKISSNRKIQQETDEKLEVRTMKSDTEIDLVKNIAKEAEPLAAASTAVDYHLSELSHGDGGSAQFVDVDTDSQSLEQVLKEKAKLEGQLEVLDLEAKIAMKERAELQAKVGVLTQQLKSMENDTMGITGDRNALAADLETLRQNRYRLELVIVDAQKLLEEKDLDIKSVGEDLQHSHEANEKLQVKLKDLKRDLQGKDTTVKDLKNKVTELYVEFQTCNQNKILAENEVGSLQSEINSLNTAREWYQTQLHQSQESKVSLQKTITELKTGNITQSTLIERLKADNMRIKQQLTDTQQKAIREKEMLARHLETIEADMVEREAAFVQMQQERQNIMAEMQQTKGDGSVNTLTSDLAEEMRKTKNELKRTHAQCAVLEHEQAELMKRLTLAQESILERDHSYESLEQKYVEAEVRVKELEMEMQKGEESLLLLKQEKVAVEVELSSVKDEKKAFDNALQTLKQDMGTVEINFMQMKQELADKNNELSKLKTSQEFNAVTVHAHHKKESEALQATSTIETTNEDIDKHGLELKLLKDNFSKESEELKAQNDSLQKQLAETLQDLQQAKSEAHKETTEKSAIERDLIITKERILDVEVRLQTLLEEKNKLETQVLSNVRDDKSHTDLEEENSKLRSRLGAIETESHREIAKQQAQVLKLGTDLEAVLREQRQSKVEHNSRQRELLSQLQVAEDRNANLQEDLLTVQNRFSLDLDEKTRLLQSEIQETKSDMESLKKENQRLDSESKESSAKFEAEITEYKLQMTTADQELQELRVFGDQKKLMDDNTRKLALDLERERGKIAGLLQSQATLKQHASQLEAQLASRESSVVEMSSHAQGEMTKKVREVTDMQELLTNLQEDVEREKQNVKDTRKQLLVERGQHTKLRRKAETMWVDYDQLQVDLVQKTAELDKVTSDLQAASAAEKDHKLELEQLSTQYQSLQMEHNRIQRQQEERVAKDPVIQEQIETLEWLVQQKTAEVEAVQSKLAMIEERQLAEVQNLHTSIQSMNSEVAVLREELSLVKKEKLDVQGKVTELRKALRSTAQHANFTQEGQIEDATDGAEGVATGLSRSAIDQLLKDTAPVPLQSKPLSFLQATLSGLRGEITHLQQHMEEHTAEVQNSSQAWRDLEAQVQDLREVCKSSAADRAASQKLLQESSHLAMTSQATQLSTSPRDLEPGISSPTKGYAQRRPDQYLSPLSATDDNSSTLHISM